MKPHVRRGARAVVPLGAIFAVRPHQPPAKNFFSAFKNIPLFSPFSQPVPGLAGGQVGQDFDSTAERRRELERNGRR
jgi:hypothetical protein